jgi:DNA polymerase III subunit epsilon
MASPSSLSSTLRRLSRPTPPAPDVGIKTGTFAPQKHNRSADTEIDPMHNQNEDAENLVRRLEATGDYKVLRRLIPQQPTTTPADRDSKLGIIVDFETTGLDAAKDEILEVSMVKFRYSSSGQVDGVTGIFQAFNQPSTPIPTDIIELTGITDDMVAGQKIDAVGLERFIFDASVVIAHNAGFDRKFAEGAWAVFAHKNWACSATEIEWQKYGFSGAKLAYLLTESGFFHAAHRALDDCYATLEILARELPNTSTTALAILLDRARRKTFRIWAENALFHLKDALKSRRYRWNDGTDGRPRSWHIDVEEDKLDAELHYLRNEIYQRDIDIDWREITALDRFSNRA